jgi:hypothetical protein
VAGRCPALHSSGVGAAGRDLGPGIADLEESVHAEKDWLELESSLE